MSKIEIFVLKEDLERAVKILHDLGLLHIEQMHLSKIMEQRGILRVGLSPEQEDQRAGCELLIRHINEIIQELKGLVRSCLEEGPTQEEKNLELMPTQGLTKIIDSRIKPQFHSIVKDMDILKDELGILPQYKEILESFALSKREIKTHEDRACLALIFNRQYEKDMEIFKKHLEEKTKSPLEVYTNPLNQKKIVALLFYQPGIAKEIDEEIFKKGTRKVELPIKYLSKPLNETIESIRMRLDEIPGQIERLKKNLCEFAKSNISLICTIKAIALNRQEEMLILNNFLQSKYTAVITGWLPSKDLSRLGQTLERSLGRNFFIFDRTRFVKHPHQIPVLLENPKRLLPYQLLLNLLPPPEYGTRDATGLVSIFFPLFFGLIVGDIGYGLIFLAISLFLKRSKKFLARSIGSILFAVSLSSVFFGILYGEFFGNLGKVHLKIPHILFDRQESIIPFLILALSVGLFHIVLGFVLGIIGALHKRDKKEEVEKIAILGGLVGLFLLVASIIKILPSKFLPPSIALLVIVVILLIIVKGFLGPLELFSAVANIFSYARLMALGLAGVMMASVANHIGGLPENIFIGIIVACLLHALNLVLSVFSPTVQSLRLHYVEFFSKFYEPGGKRYNPFRKKGVRECIS